MSMGSAGTDWVLFLGRLHPLIVHLPIGLLMAVVIAEAIACVQRTEKMILLRRSLLAVTAGSAIVASLVGWFLASPGGYAPGLLFWHRWGGIAFASLLVLAFVLCFTKLWGSLLLRAGVMLCALTLMTLVGHFGGSMTHGETYLARYAPGWMQGVLGGGAVPAESALVSTAISADTQLVLSLFESSCIECHGPAKQKGKLRLDQPEGILSVLTVGDPAKSELFRRLTLPIGHDELMPPDSQPVADDDVLAVMRWIRDGARMQGIEDQLQKQAEAAATITMQLDEIEQSTGAVITVLPEGDGNTYAVDLSIGDGVIDAAVLGSLAPIAAQISDLSLSGRTIGVLPEELQFDGLQRLGLGMSRINEAQVVAFLNASPQLQALNVHSTAVGDPLLDEIKDRRNLRDVVLYNTLVTPGAIAALQRVRPDLRISAGETLQESFVQSEPRRILAGDYSKGRIALMREVALGKPDTIWEHEVRDIHDLHLLPDGNILFQTSWTRVIEVNPASGEIVWSYEAAQMNRAYEGEPVEVHAFERYSNGITMIAESGPARIIEVDPSGNLLHEIPLSVEHPDTHHDTRLVRRTDSGTYLVAHEKDGVVREYDRSGVVVWSYDVPRFWIDPITGREFTGDGDQVFSAVRLRSGNTLIGTGNGHSVLEISPAGEIVWAVAGDELDGVRLAWVTTVQELSNGHIVIGNCHAGDGQPQIIEVNREKEIIWSFKDFERFGNALANSFVTEDPDGFAYTE